MRFYEFTKEVEKEMSAYLGKKAEVHISTIQKNNGVKMEGLVIRENGERIAPTIYLNCFYERFLQGMEIEDVIKEIDTIYKSCKNHPLEDAEFFSDYEQVKNRVVYKLIHKERNRELLEDVPYIPYLDLAIVFYCIVFRQEYGNATILIHKEHMELWNVTEEELYEQASKNTPILLPYFIKSIEEIMGEQFEKELSGQGKKEIRETMDMVRPASEQVSMYVLSNQEKLYGAASILYPNLLKNFAIACGRDFYILPSSVHEVILVPEYDSKDLEGMSEMVKEINELEVAREEILSDHAYYYDKEEERILFE
ncbi:MAG: hypothetical protein HDR22_04605 [Lachnospiraceae bacterium]|nr:hypothetical protein [Lachnospiraceae bacterium]